jgi:GNAT superfamily N-acetyltransferase
VRIFERARPEDAEAIERLFGEAGRASRMNGATVWDEGYPNREIIDEDIARGELWALTEGGVLIAVVSLLEEDFENGVDAGWTRAPSCILSRLCVHPARQGQGIAAEMMRRATWEAARQGYRATRHLTSVDNPAALRLYRRLGYRELRRVRLFGSDYIAFERLIAPAP